MSEVQSRIDTLQKHFDEVFHRVNADPIYQSREEIADAISDNLRYFDADRKADLAEVFFALLEQMYDRVEHPGSGNSFCDPAAAPGDRFPEVEMLCRDIMPMAWALSAEWNPPELRNTYCEYFQSYSQEESAVIFETLEFFAQHFEELGKSPFYEDVRDFWHCMAYTPEALREEDDEIRSKLLDVLLAKKIASQQKKS